MFNIKTSKIKYKSVYPEYENVVQPTKNNIPEWYKKISPHSADKIRLGRIKEHSVKKCIPFLDSLNLGYVVTTPGDIFVEQMPEGVVVEWTIEGPLLIKSRAAGLNQDIPVPMGCDKTHFLWSLPTSFQIPKGYSALITHPLNRHDLPFITLSGVIDGGDFIMHPGGNLPFFMSNTFRGVIPKGTPIAQIIPFKTENWNLEKTDSLLDLAEISRKQSNAVFSEWYKKTFWQKKTYN
jgi:hypothetical protein